MSTFQSRFILKLGVGITLIYLAWLPPGIYSIDGNSMLSVAESICVNHSLVVPVGLGIPGRAGLIYSLWYPLLSFLVVPFVEVGVVIARIVHLPVHYLAALCGLALQSLISGAAAAFVAGLAFRLGADWTGARLAALSFAFGTIAMTYARTFFAEPLLTLMTVVSLYAAFGATTADLTISAVFCGGAVLSKPTGIILGPIIAIFVVAKTRKLRLALFPLLGTFAGFVIYAAYNYWRFEDLFSFNPHANQGFNPALLPVGATGLLMSPAQGLVFYCPAVIAAILGVRLGLKANRFAALTIVGVAIGYLLVYSPWTFWGGGWSWGPRYLLPALAVLMAFSGILTNRLRQVLVLLTILGFLVNAPTMFSFYERYLAERNDQGLGINAWDIQSSPALHAWPAAFRETRDAMHTPVTSLTDRLQSGPSSHIAGSKALRVVALWWWLLPAAHISRWIGVLISALLTTLGIWLIVISTCPKQVNQTIT